MEKDKWSQVRNINLFLLPLSFFLVILIILYSLFILTGIPSLLQTSISFSLIFLLYMACLLAPLVYSFFSLFLIEKEGWELCHFFPLLITFQLLMHMASLSKYVTTPNSPVNIGLQNNKQQQKSIYPILVVRYMSKERIMPNRYLFTSPHSYLAMCP